MASAIFITMSAAFAQDMDIDDLVYMAENYPPANYIENGELRGASVEVLKLMWKTMGYPEQPIKVLSWVRGFKLVQTEKNHVLFTMSRTEERENLFKWVGPIFKGRQVLVGLADRDITLHSLEDAKHFKIGTIRDDVAEMMLLNAGFDRQKLESVVGHIQNIKKLLSGRVDFICLSEDAIRQLTKIHHYDPKRLKTYLVVNETKNYYAFHKDTPDKLIQRFQEAFDSLKEEHTDILKNYNMGP